jgi:arabinogalactan oligomer/maltooligosaccharide transport system substrate-binding protein
MGISTVAPDAIRCAGSGPVQLWTAPIEDRLVQALAVVAQTFNAVCPEIHVEVSTFQEGIELLAAIEETPEDTVTLVLGPGQWAIDLAETGRFVPVDSLLEAALLRRILPAALESLRANGQLYGLPLSVETTALYVNRNRVPNPATTLDELLNEARIGRRVALLTDGTMALWGLGAFGGAPPSATAVDSVVATPEAIDDWPSEDALVEWFRWLQRAQTTPGVTLGDANNQALTLFSNGRLAYYTGGPDLLAQLRPSLDEALDVITLPNGPAGPATPLIQSQAIYFPTAFFAEGTGAAGAQAAISFTYYLIGLEAQTLLMEQANQVPANRLVNTVSFPLIAKFAEQAATAIPYPSSTGPEFLDTLDEVTAQILNGQLSPEGAVARLSALRMETEEN